MPFMHVINTKFEDVKQDQIHTRTKTSRLITILQLAAFASRNQRPAHLCTAQVIYLYSGATKSAKVLGSSYPWCASWP